MPTKVCSLDLDNSYRDFIFKSQNMNEESSFKVYDWMINRLHLSGNNLLVYAFIYSSQHEEKASINELKLQELSFVLGISERTLYRILSYLCNKGLIIKECKYNHLNNYKVKTIYNIKTNNGTSN